MSSFFDMLDQYKDVKPAERTAQNPTTRDLPESTYQGEIQGAECREVPDGDGSGKKPLLILFCKFAGVEGIYEHQYWLTYDIPISNCYADMVTLGLSPAGSLSNVLMGQINQLTGKKFTLKRKNNVSKSNGKTYQNAYIRVNAPQTPVNAPAFPSTKAGSVSYNSVDDSPF